MVDQTEASVPHGSQERVPIQVQATSLRCLGWLSESARDAIHERQRYGRDQRDFQAQLQLNSSAQVTI